MTVKVFHTGVTPKPMKEIKAYMEENNIDFIIQDITTTPIKWSEFMSMIQLAEEGLDDLLPSKKSKNANKLLEAIDLESITLKQYHQHITENPILIRTPIIMDHKNMVIGSSKEEMTRFDNKKDKKARFSQLLESVRMMEAYELQVELGYN